MGVRRAIRAELLRATLFSSQGCAGVASAIGESALSPHAFGVARIPPRLI